MIKEINLKNKLMELIENIDKDKYVLNPGKDFSRDRKMNFSTFIKFVLSNGGQSINKELLKYFEYDKDTMSTSAFVQQRDKVSFKLFEDLFYKFNNISNSMDKNTYKGYKVFAIDGSDINIARNPNSDSYCDWYKDTPGYNQLHLNALYDCLNKTYVGINIQPKPKSDERAATIEILNKIDLKDKTILTADRGYESLNLIEYCNRKDNLYYCIRVQNSKLKELKALPLMKLDKMMSITICFKNTKENKDKGYHYIQKRQENKSYSKNTIDPKFDYEDLTIVKFRVIRFMLSTGEYETLVTNLPKNFTINDFKELYHLRWAIETSFRELKYDAGLVSFHAKKESSILQEIYAKLIFYNFSMRILKNVKITNTTKYEYQINYSQGLFILRQFIKNGNLELDSLLKRAKQPIREGRKDKRNLKAKSVVSFSYRIA